MNYYNFRFQMNQALSLISSDDQVIKKMMLNLWLNMALKLSEVVLFGVVIYVAGVSFGYFPMIQVLTLTQGFKQCQAFIAEVQKYRKFNNFLANLNNDYPLVRFNRDEHGNDEECAICKEPMG
jgi:hypothetical protein